MLAIDSHLHYYECYDPQLFLKTISDNLGSIGPGAERAGVILDRSNMRGYERLAESSSALPDMSVENDVITYTSDSGTVRVYRGIQVACQERFEVLGLFCSLPVADGVSALEAVERISGQGGVPVVAWAPGKWMFARRALVRDLLAKVDAGKVAIGDTSLRPTIWNEPSLMRRFRKSGGSVLCGSDPLPYSGQEGVAGTYASCIRTDGALDAVSAVKAGVAGEIEMRSAGRRSAVAAFAVRLLRNSLLK